MGINYKFFNLLRGNSYMKGQKSDKVYTNGQKTVPCENFLTNNLLLLLTLKIQCQ